MCIKRTFFRSDVFVAMETTMNFLVYHFKVLWFWCINLLIQI